MAKRRVSPVEKSRASLVEWHYQVPKWHIMFVNNVSKRIHSKTLKESFQAYGVVTDVFIAYRSRMRLLVGSTFAFVRFRNKSEADKAVCKDDGRFIDGFKIRVFHDNKGVVEVERAVDGSSIKKVWKPSLRDSRSFKEVLEGLQSAEGRKVDYVDNVDNVQHSLSSRLDKVIHLMIDEGKYIRQESTNGEENTTICIKEKEVSWRKSCLVGKIKNMFNEDIIQAAFCAEGYDVKVSICHDLLVVIQFQHEVVRQECWFNREERLHRWFDELELLEGYENKVKIKVWIHLFDVPLAVWSKDFFMDLGSRWGKVMRIDEDTCDRRRFDVAKILMEVQYVSDVPERAFIVFNGRVSPIKLLQKFKKKLECS
ncbi:uncharacterized protein LOC120124752 [Hibiscus syriacus]|uniref:uncharacterized protein LOC120124752 n=1 Tax=Hibiscus syriacus TaxID=106335 RepID=UPI001923E68D|nr:uncharacterized protein LOC120124752 [Hibiscus syriacus]